MFMYNVYISKYCCGLQVFSLYIDIPWQQNKWLDVTVLRRLFTFLCLSVLRDISALCVCVMTCLNQLVN